MIKSLKEIKSLALSELNEKHVSKEDINYLLQENFSLKPYEISLNLRKEFDDELFVERFNRINEGEPLYYVLGKAPFYGLEFKVKEGITLIPRNETEELVKMALNIMSERNMDNPSVLDVGTGTGCIAISIDKNYKCEVDAIDISSEALEVAKENGMLLRSNVNFSYGNALDGISKKYDIIISNPPYIDRDTFVEESVLKYEPHIALFADNHGLIIYERIFSRLPECLSDRGVALFEISPDLEKGLVEMMGKYLGGYRYKFVKDMNKFLRFLIIAK